MEHRAYHESGHAVSRLRLGIPFEEVVAEHQQFVINSGPPHSEFLDTDFSAPQTLADARKTQWHARAQELIGKLIVSAAAGPLAQMEFEGHQLPEDTVGFHKFGGSDDLNWIEGYALGLACQQTPDDDYAISLKQLIVKESVGHARALIMREWEAINCVAQALIQRGRLQYDDVLRRGRFKIGENRHGGELLGCRCELERR